MRRKLLLFLYSTANILGCCLALMALVAFFAGLIKSYWLFIVLGSYALGYLITPKTSIMSSQANHELTARELKACLDALIKKISSRVSKPVLNKVISIKENILVLLPHLEEMSTGEYDVHIIKQTVLDYLPQTLSTYLELPPAFAKMHKMRNGKTPQEALIEQLSLLEEQIDCIVMNVNNEDTEALMAQGEFLKSKFKRHDWL